MTTDRERGGFRVFVDRDGRSISGHPVGDIDNIRTAQVGDIQSLLWRFTQFDG